MSIKIYDRALLEAANRLIRDHAIKLAAELNQFDPDIEKINDLISTITSILRDNTTALTGKSFLIQVDFNTPAGVPDLINFAKLNSALVHGFKLIKIDIKMNISTLNINTNFSDSSLTVLSRSFTDGCMFYVRNGREIKVYVNGWIIDEINAINPANIPSADKRTALNARDYKESLKLFYDKRVRYSQFSSHWKNKDKRILVADKTEEVFQRNLYNWLQENIEGGRAQIEVGKITSDRTDIEIRLLESSDYYIIEVKWLGRNDNGTSYGVSRLREGIDQVNNYLVRDPEVSEVCLVVYDGRILDEFTSLEGVSEALEQWKEIQKCGDKTFDTNGTGYVFFLENRSASERRRTT